MKRASLIPLICVGTTLFVVPTAPWADDEIYACPDAQGNVVYQDTPCINRRVDPPAPPSPASPLATPAPPKPSTPPPEPVAHRAAVPPRAVPHVVRGGRPAPRRRAPSALRFPTRLDRLEPTVGAMFASPEQTWRSLLAAIQDGDRAAALLCFTPAGLARYGPHAEAFRVEALGDLIDTFTKIEGEGEVGPFWSIRALRSRERPKWIFFERTVQGEWKIVGL